MGHFGDEPTCLYGMICLDCMVRRLLLLHTAVTPSGECYEVKAGVVCLQVKLCDPHLSALVVMVRFSR